MTPPPAPRVAVVGCGYWGRNLVRNFSALGALAAVHDRLPYVAARMAEEHSVPAVGLPDILKDEAIAGVVIAAPASQHFLLAREALVAGKDVFVEKPLALRVEEAVELCQLADGGGRVLMVGHLLQYHPAFLALQTLVHGGDLGRVRYLYSNRLNLGRFRREEDILWSFAPHDISMILALVGSEPSSVSAVGGTYLHATIADVTTTHLSFPGGEKAHVFVSWLHPEKEQRLVVVGEDAMAVFDDGQQWEAKLRLFRHRITWRDGVPEPVRAESEAVSVTPQEPLRAECAHFLDCVATRATPRTGGAEGLRVLRVLQAAGSSLSTGGGAATVAASPTRFPGAYVHESAYVDEPAVVGPGTRIWHFSHVMPRAHIGRDCTVGQNVLIGPDVKVGDRCRIQNNVSVYKGVTLEDEVFCGPSCVFTNVANPRAFVEQKDAFRPTLVRRGATIGANATIVCGHTVGAYAMVAAGAVVTHDVPDHALVAGVPARRLGWVSHAGERLGDDLVCPRTGRRYRLVDGERLEEEAAEPAPTRVELVDLAAQRRVIGERVDSAIARVLAHGRFVMGPEVGEFEAALAGFCGARHVVSCSSGTDALVLALLAEEVGPGDAVVVPAFTFAATAEAVALIGATPVFADVRADTFDLDPASARAAVRAARGLGLRPRAIVAVDLFGQPADYDGLAALTQEEGLLLVADAAQSVGATWQGRSVGTLAALTATSFFPAKPLGCYGDGGAVLTDDDGRAALLRSLRVHGHGADKYDNVRIGINGRLDTLQAAVLLEKLAVLAGELEQRAAVAARYSTALADVVTIPAVRPGATSAWAAYTIVVPDRDRVGAALAREGISTAIYYPRPLHDQPAYRRFPKVPAGLAIATALAGRVLSLPIHPYLGEAVQDRVCGALRRAIGDGSREGTDRVAGHA